VLNRRPARDHVALGSPASALKRAASTRSNQDAGGVLIEHDHALAGDAQGKLEVPTPFGDHQVGVPARTAMRGAGSGDHTSGLAGLVWCLRYVDHDLTVTAIDRRALGRPVLAVDSDALRQLAQRRGPSPLRSEQVVNHRTD